MMPKKRTPVGQICDHLDDLDETLKDLQAQLQRAYIRISDLRHLTHTLEADERLAKKSKKVKQKI